ncbi:hypothetical protein [Burkholderia territorii]|uniref:hypothetical protein n=1 Tax=Burkholderia territorii TaxID=1503055 RepID=UPI0012D9CCD2|nr:hypothetical protein [Burkholderia territorii]
MSWETWRVSLTGARRARNGNDCADGAYDRACALRERAFPSGKGGRELAVRYRLAATRAFPFGKGCLSIDRFSRHANAVMIAVIDNTIFRRQP